MNGPQPDFIWVKDANGGEPTQVFGRLEVRVPRVRLACVIVDGVVYNPVDTDDERWIYRLPKA